MKAVGFEIIFSLEARTLGSENKGAIFSNMAPLFLRASRGKEFESDPFIGSKLGYKSFPKAFGNYAEVQVSRSFSKLEQVVLRCWCVSSRGEATDYRPPLF